MEDSKIDVLIGEVGTTAGPSNSTVLSDAGYTYLMSEEIITSCSSITLSWNVGSDTTCEITFGRPFLISTLL